MSQTQQPIAFAPVDFFSKGTVESREASDRMNSLREQAYKAAAMMREVNPEFAEMPVCFQPVFASLVLLGASPNNLVGVTSSDGTHFLLGTIVSPDGRATRIFEMRAEAGTLSDTDVLMRNLPNDPGSDSVDYDQNDALALLEQIAALLEDDRDYLLHATSGTTRH